MSLKEQLFEELKNAMREKNTLRKNTVQSIRTAVLQVEKDDHVELSDDGVIQIIASQLKKRRAALPEYEKSGREDLISELKQEIEMLIEYLPRQLSEEEITVIVQQTVDELGITTQKDMGKVMSAVVAKVSGKADNKLVSQIVRSILA
ncbi:MAG: aspartyl-tRNA amidotransferase [Firmicutes bacterium HGW-Firmicutes-7]|nr:MAG: aspartyl-tRNA amidotransferase [Firmicutes bacterium HGW-Firmicutes-7]